MTIAKMAQDTKTSAAPAATQNRMSESFLTTAASWAGFFAVGFTAAAAVSGLAAWYFSGELSKMNAAKLAAFQEESRTTIASADARSAEANQKAAEANKLAEGFQLDIAKANEGAAAATALAEKERLARLQLEARLADRRLSEVQQKEIVEALKPLGPFSAQVFTYSDVTEVSRIAQAIQAILVSAEWTVGLAAATGGVTVSGIVMAVGQDAASDVRNATTRLVQELARHGVSSTVSDRPMEQIPEPGMSFGNKIPNPQIRILIGTK